MQVKKIAVSLHRQNRNGWFWWKIGLWCNGNTTDSGPVFPGSSPGSPTKRSKMKVLLLFFILCYDVCYKSNCAKTWQGFFEKMKNFLKNLLMFSLKLLDEFIGAPCRVLTSDKMHFSAFYSIHSNYCNLCNRKICLCILVTYCCKSSATLSIHLSQERWID